MLNCILQTIPHTEGRSQIMLLLCNAFVLVAPETCSLSAETLLSRTGTRPSQRLGSSGLPHPLHTSARQDSRPHDRASYGILYDSPTLKLETSVSKSYCLFEKQVC